MGYISKMSFKDKIDDKTITLINVYFLQVFLTFWGLLIRPIDINLIIAPSIYLFIVFISVIFAAFVAKFIFYDKKEYSIATVAAIIGNTGNLGIPINIAIFGEESIPYTTIVNLVNVFVVYTIGVFYYSRGSYDTKTSLLNIIKLPILWAAIIAILLSIYEVPINNALMKTLMMGAYASMTMQLFLFGIYLYGTKISDINKKLLLWSISLKFLILPIFAILVLSYIDLEPIVKGVVFIELLMPLAVANVNLASLYDCKPRIVTALVFISSIIFLGMIFLGVKLLAYI
jgi:predicted permease